MSAKKQTDYMSYIRGNVRIEWEYLGEGVCGDYDPDDKNDEPLLRFTVSKKINGNWEQIEDASYCTLVNIYTPKKTLKEYLRVIYQNVSGDVRGGMSIKRCCEWLSWIGSDEEPKEPLAMLSNAIAGKSINLGGDRVGKRIQERT
jgi:hypothetical protein